MVDVNIARKSSNLLKGERGQDMDFFAVLTLAELTTRLANALDGAVTNTANYHAPSAGQHGNCEPLFTLAVCIRPEASLGIASGYIPTVNSNI